jgi:DNA-binding NarL/FixJ family response regulator
MAPPGRRPTVLLADDHAILVEGLVGLLERDFSLVGTVTDGSHLIDAARRLRPDVIVADVAMPGLSGIEALRRLKLEGNPAKVIILTMHADAQLAAEALRAGASGFVVKHSAGKELIEAIRAAVRGGTYVTPPLAPDVLKRLTDDRAAGADVLTSRQREVAALIAAGRTMKEVAATLGLSPRTVESHKYQIMATLGLRTNAELIRYALEHGLTGPPLP